MKIFFTLPLYCNKKYRTKRMNSRPIDYNIVKYSIVIVSKFQTK